MSLLSLLDPAPVWTYFEEICKIPRLSRNEIRIRHYLLDFASRNKLEHKEDIVGNILISRPSSQGFGKRKTIVLQSHMDMVGEKNADYHHNWETDPIVPIVKDGWVGASGTTLGADDGIGIAAQMAILTDKTLKTGKIECLFTVDEESGMTGAINLKHDFFTGRTLLNLDSEDEGILFIGCAGGIDTVATLKYATAAITGDVRAFDIILTGLHGGHSGDEIHHGYGNSVKIMTALLQDLTDKFGISVSKFNGGNLRNAIPREAFATIVVNKEFEEHIIKNIDTNLKYFKNKFGSLEPDLKIVIKLVNIPATTMESMNQSLLLKTLSECPHGVISWSKEMEDLVETSTNLASIKFHEGNIIEIITTQRSSSESAKHKTASDVEACFALAGADVVHSHGYPGWKPNLSSDILKLTRSSYVKLFGKEPKVRAIHAGLECGLIYEKNKSIDMISFGPSIKGAHTPEEMINIESTVKFWNLLIDVINNIPEE